jgi:predicted NBD/HSP70 family sugar kinase
MSSEYLASRLSVLKAIRREGPISRSQLPAITGLSGGTITQLTSSLVRRGLVVEKRDCERRNGRPRTYLEINAGGGIVLGAGIKADRKLSVAFADLTGQQLLTDEADLQQPESIEDLAREIGEVLLKTISASPFDAAEVLRVGLAIPAVVDSLRGTVHYLTTFPQGSVPFADIVSSRLGIPVTIENDQTCMARAEHWFGSARKLDTFTFVHVGHAVNSAEYWDGLPKAGTNGLNPELGHVKMAFSPDAPPCFCGGRGCLTAFSSIFGMLRRADMIDTSRFPDLPDLDALFARLLDQAEAGDALANDVLDRGADYLGAAVANLVTATDPGNVLIAVDDVRLVGRLKPRFEVALQEYTMPGVLPATQVGFVVTGPDWRCQGSAALALEQTYLGDGGTARAAECQRDTSTARIGSNKSKREGGFCVSIGCIRSTGRRLRSE